MKILAIDPGNEESAYVVMDENYKILRFDKIDNETLLHLIDSHFEIDIFAIEMVANMGMAAVGATLFETAFWIGRFWEISPAKVKYKIYRRDEKLNICGTMRAKDTNIRQALIDRFGGKGTKKVPGWFYGFKADCWQAYAVGVTYIDWKRREKDDK